MLRSVVGMIAFGIIMNSGSKPLFSSLFRNQLITSLVRILIRAAVYL
jgi:hypothetical protein